MKDLHLHLSGATSASTLWEIVRESGLKTTAKSYRDFERSVLMDRAAVESLDDYLAVLHVIDEAQSSPLAVKRSVFDAYKHAFLSGCEFLELRWNVVKRSQKGRIDLDSLIVAARAGFEKAGTIYGIRGGMTLCLGRDCSEAENEALFKKAIQYNGKGIVGIDIAGPETKLLSREFAFYYQAANAAGMITTAHVGETDHERAEEELTFALEKLKVQRIGHGIQITRFPKLAALAAKAGVLFEVCITSNLTTKAVPSLVDFKRIFKFFEDKGLRYVICTDATAALKTNIAREHELHEKIRSLSADELVRYEQETQSRSV